MVAPRDYRERFAERHIPEPNTGCWLWTDGVDAYGYGRLKVGRTWKRAHRVGYELMRGPIPDGMVLRHACDQRACVNPNHLIPGTNAENVRDRETRGRAAAQDGVGKRKLTSEQVREIRGFLRQEKRIMHRDLARIYGVSVGTIGVISRGQTWRHVTIPIDRSET